MRISELLTETTEEDRAIVSLSTAIGRYLYINHYASNANSTVNLGKIGDLFDTPLVAAHDIAIVLQNQQNLWDTAVQHGVFSADSEPRELNGLWIPESNSLYLNSENIGASEIYTTIAHELRHALDTYKSDIRANLSRTYTQARRKQHRRLVNDPYAQEIAYLARRDEINARFSQVLYQLTPLIHRQVRRGRPDVFDKVVKDFMQLLRDNRIAELFPEKYRSTDYKRLVKRAVDYIQKELTHAMNKYNKNNNSQKMSEHMIYEIDYTPGVEQISSDLVKHIIANSKEVGDFENRRVYFIQVQDHDIYSYITNGQINAAVFLTGNNLRGVKNYSNTRGLVTALVAFIAHRLKRPVVISSSEQLSPAGFKWLYSLLNAGGRGLKITDQTGKFPDKENLKAEWKNAMKSDTHGPTRIVIESTMKRHFRTIEEFDRLIFKPTFFIGDETIL
jgi:hypothetical protein